jgi:hypothetical protein
MQVKLGHAPDWRHAKPRAMFQRPVRIRGLGKMNKMLVGIAGFIVAMAPLAASGQGLHVSAVIPTQTLLPHTDAFPHLAQRAPAVVAVAPPVVKSCNMLVAKPAANAPGTDQGGVAPPQNRARPIITVKPACVNRMADEAPDSELLKKP